MIFRAKNLEFWTSNWLLEQWTLEMSWVQHKCVLPCLFCVFLVILVRRITITVKSVVFCLFRGYNQPALLLLENQENCYCLLVFLLYLTTSYKRKPISRHTVDTVFENHRKTLIHYCELKLAVKQYYQTGQVLYYKTGGKCQN